jgi:hypothetical protein
MSDELHSTIRAEHIEKPEKPFFVRFTRLPFVNEYLRAQEKMLIKVMAQTEAGAVQIAAYHYGRLGKDFSIELREARELPGDYPVPQVSFLDHDFEISL